MQICPRAQFALPYWMFVVLHVELCGGESDATCRAALRPVLKLSYCQTNLTYKQTDAAENIHLASLCYAGG